MIKYPRAQCQRVPSHIGLADNEKADDLAKSGANLPQHMPTETLNSTKFKITTVVDRSTKEAQRNLAIENRRDPLVTTPLPRDLGATESRLLTGYDYL